jgi:hypothetical protein
VPAGRPGTGRIFSLAAVSCAVPHPRWDLNAYHLYHATCAELLRQLGHPDQARTAGRHALPCSSNGSPSPNGAHPATAPDRRRTRTAVQLRGSVLHCCLRQAARQQTRG